jgi:hypothetical protein
VCEGWVKIYEGWDGMGATEHDAAYARLKELYQHCGVCGAGIHVNTGT